MDDFGLCDQRYAHAGALGLLDTDLDNLLFVAPPPPCPAVVPTSADAIPIFSGATAPPLGFELPPLDLAVQAAEAPPLPPPPAQPAAPSAAPSAGPSSSAPSSSAQDKAAIAREKNRLAQRRFREKEKQRLAEVQSKAESLGEQMARLKLENAELAHLQRLLEKTLTVRNAMLALVNRLEPELGANGSGGGLPGAASANLLHEDASLQAASRQLAAAVGELPSMEQVEVLVSRLPDSASSGASSDDSVPSTAGLHAGSSAASPVLPHGPAAGSQAPDGSYGTPAASSAAASAVGVGVSTRLSDVVAAAVGGDHANAAERLQEVGVPPPDNASVRQTVQEIERVEDLVGAYHDWRQRMAVAYAAAEGQAFQPGQGMQQLEAQVKGMAELWWYAAQLKPRIFKSFVLAVLPPRGLDVSAWAVKLAEQSMDILTEKEIVALRQAWQRYMRRATVAAVAARPWVQRLQDLLSQPGSEAMADMAQQHLKVAEVASRLSQACQEQYTAAMAFLLDIGTNVRTHVRCFWHLSAEGHMPDHPSLISEILRLHQQRRLAAQPARQLPPTSQPAQ